MTTTRTHIPLVIAAVGNNLWLGQVGSGGNPFSGIGSIRTRTEHGFVLLVRMLGPELYDKCPSGTIPKPGKDAIVSVLRPEEVGPGLCCRFLLIPQGILGVSVGEPGDL